MIRMRVKSKKTLFAPDSRGGNPRKRFIAFQHHVDHYKKIFAVTHALEIIGEAANHLSPQFRSRYPPIPWEDINGMRHIVVHGYFGVDIDVIWRTAKEDVPVLRQQIQQILDSFVEDE